MTPIRKFFYSLAVFAAFVALLQLPFSFAISSVLSNPDNVDTALKEGGAYDNAVSFVLDDAAKNTQEAETKDLLNDQEIKNVIGSSVQPADVQYASKSVIAGLYAWLEGKTPQPEFTIDLTVPANRATENLSAFAQKRAASLPPCTIEQLQTVNFQEDVLSIPCLPPGVASAQVGQQFAEQAKQKVDLLKDPVISSSKLREQGDIQEFDKSNLPEAYQNLHNSKWFVLGIAAILIALLVFGRRNRLAGVRVVGILLLVCAGILGLVLLVFTAGKGQITTDTKMAEVAANTVLHLFAQLFNVVRWFAIGYALAGIAALLIVRKLTQKPQRPENPEAPANPVTIS